MPSYRIRIEPPEDIRNGVKIHAIEIYVTSVKGPIVAGTIVLEELAGNYELLDEHIVKISEIEPIGDKEMCRSCHQPMSAIPAVRYACRNEHLEWRANHP